MKKSLAALSLLLLSTLPVFAQGPGGRGGRGGAQGPPQQVAPFDITGTWISVVTEDWMFRMVTPPKGQYLGVPMNRAAREVADAWDPKADQAAGLACKGYGGAAIMRRPGRLRISWPENDEVRIEAEAGEQVRNLQFNAKPPAGAERTWQGFSAAEWNFQNAAQGQPRRGTLQVTTTDMLPGYLRKNGVPYSEDATVTEYFDSYTASNGDIWLVITTSVHDPMYLTTDFVTSSHFKKVVDGDTTWIPEPCSAE